MIAIVIRGMGVSIAIALSLQLMKESLAQATGERDKVAQTFSELEAHCTDQNRPTWGEWGIAHPL